MKYIILQKINHEWLPNETDSDEQGNESIATYDSLHEAQIELTYHLDAIQRAVRLGDMVENDAELPENYKIVPYNPEVHDAQWEAIGG